MSAESPEVRSLVAELLDAVRDQAGPLPLLLDCRGACKLLGLSKAGFYRLISGGELPRPVDVPGSGPRWRRAELERWVQKLKTRRGS